MDNIKTSVGDWTALNASSHFKRGNKMLKGIDSFNNTKKKRIVFYRVMYNVHIHRCSERMFYKRLMFRKRLCTKKARSASVGAFVSKPSSAGSLKFIQMMLS